MQVFELNSIKEENAEATTLDDLSHYDAPFKEETQNTQDNNYLGLCRQIIASTVQHDKDEDIYTEMDFVDCANSKILSSSKTIKPFETSVPSSNFQIITASDCVSEYITSDPIDPNLTNSPFGESKDAELDSGSDWEQEYLASKNVCSKSKTVNKRSIQAKQDHKVSEKYPRSYKYHIINME